jgi:hypothetical protein
MGVAVNHTPSVVTFASTAQDLAPLSQRDAALSFEQTGERISVDLQAQGEGPEALQKGALVLDLVDYYQAVPVFEKLFAQEECNKRNGREKRANIHQEVAVLVDTLAKKCQIMIKCGW